MLRAFGSPSLYIQGPGALEQLSSTISRLGRRVFVICDPVVARLLGPELNERLNSIDGEYLLEEFVGECTAEEIDRLSAACDKFDGDVIVGIGGGKAIDTAKGVRLDRGAPLVIIPTIASNDSPTSRICVVYTDDHVLSHVRTMDTNPDAVLVDTNILVKAPKRFFVSGVGDALSKKFEAAQCLAAGGLNFYKHNPPFLAAALAEECFNAVLENAEAALHAIETGSPNEAFERSVEATILLSGLAFENGGLSIPHSLTRGLSSVPEIADTLHGEQVAFGLIVQLIMEGREDDLFDRIYRFCGKLGLPRTLHELGYQDDPKKVAGQISRVSVEKAPYIQNFPVKVTPDLVETALLRASTIGGAYQ